MAIITISKIVGTLGDEIAKAVADKLGYEFLDREIADALSEYGLRIDDKDKFNERGLSFWEHFYRRKERFHYHLKAVVCDFAKRGNVVIYGWGAQVLFKDLPGVLRVRITAPFEVRMRRLVEQQGYDEINAEKKIRKRDYDSAGYVRSFFNADWEDKDLYDLILNTETITKDTAVELIIKTAGAEELKVGSEKTATKLADLALTQRGQAALMDTPGSGAVILDVEKGVANLSGLVGSSTESKECELAISNIDGIAQVKNQIRIVNDT